MTSPATARRSSWPPGRSTIHRLDLVETPDADHAVFEAECGKGTYVRALARDLGRAARLPRPCRGPAPHRGSGPFAETDMISLAKLEALCHRAAAGEGSLADALLPVATALDDIPALAVSSGGCGTAPAGPSRPVARTGRARLPRHGLCHGIGAADRPGRSRPRRDRPQARVQPRRPAGQSRPTRRCLTMSITASRKAEVIKSYAPRPATPVRRRSRSRSCPSASPT